MVKNERAKDWPEWRDRFNECLRKFGTQEEFARRIKVSDTLVHYWVTGSGNRKPSKKFSINQAVIEEIFDVPRGYLDFPVRSETTVRLKSERYQISLITENGDMLLDHQIIQANRDESFYYSTNKYNGCYALYAQDNSNYPEILGPGDGYAGDIVVFQKPTRSLQPRHRDFVHIEVKDADRRIRTIREWIVLEGSGVNLQAVDKTGKYLNYPRNSKAEKIRIKILGIFVELRRTGRRS